MYGAQHSECFQHISTEVTSVTLFYPTLELLRLTKSVDVYCSQFIPSTFYIRYFLHQIYQALSLLRKRDLAILIHKGRKNQEEDNSCQALFIPM